MRSHRFVVPLVVLGLILASAPALADGMILPEALSPDYLAVRSHHVTVSIEDGHAVTRVDQEFTNPHDQTVAGRYVFPIPPGAVLSGFSATVDGQPQAVTRQDRATTNATLYAGVVQRHDPSLLQYADWESLAFEISLPPGGSRRMQLQYEEMLAPAGGFFHYRYVLGTERYSSQLLDEVSVTVDLRSSAGLASLYSSSHAVTVERPGPGQARVSWQASGVRPTEDFNLFFAPAEGGLGAGLLTGQRNGDDHFLLVLAPDAAAADAQRLPKDIVFVIDRSGSMAGEKIEQARSALQFVLGQLGEGDRFSIVGFDDQLAVLSPTLRPAEGQALVEARRFVAALESDGSTDLAAALQTGLRILAGSEPRAVPRLVVFLTDGLPTAGVVDEGQIAELARAANAPVEARLHVFGVGYDVNTHLLDRLAADGGGTVTYVQPGENLEVALTGFYKQIANPVLTDVTVEFEGLAVRDLYPDSLPDLFEGSSLVLTGRYRAAGQAATVRIRGWAGDEPRETVYRFDLAQTGGHDFVPRLWATRRVGVLLDRVRVEGETPALVEDIRGLGLAYGLVTPYTTFVIAGQASGAASTDNMALYGQADLNRAWGQTTIQARVQNQAYQQADQASLAAGANVSNWGERSLAQVGAVQVDLSLFQQGSVPVPDGPITADWVATNVQADRTVTFGSDEYRTLTQDPEARLALQGGSQVVFAYQGQVIEIRDPEAPAVDPVVLAAQPGQVTQSGSPVGPDRAPGGGLAPAGLGSLLSLALAGGLACAGLLGLGLLGVVGLVVYRGRRDRAR